MRWKEEIQNSIKTIEQLEKHLPLSQNEKTQLKMVVEQFPMRITPYYFNLINLNDPFDPIKNIVVPNIEELSDEGFFDTSGETLSTKARGLQHKYSTTALLLLDNVCAGYCRFCFRKRLMNGKIPSREILSDFDSTYEYIASHKEIDNVLISGGDPFMLSNEKIEYILRSLRELDHINIIRIGTKMLAFSPFRFSEDQELIYILFKYNLPKKRIYIISHFSHPKELTSEAIKAIKALNNCGIIICNQTVLLRGVNNDPLIIRELFNKLAFCGVEPYYLFQCRPVKGTHHFGIPLNEGYAIYEEAKRGMSGLVKRVRYVMSHFLGKIEILNIENKKEFMRGYFKFHQTRYPYHYGKFFKIDLPYDTFWLKEEMLEKYLSQNKKSYEKNVNNKFHRNLRLLKYPYPPHPYNQIKKKHLKFQKKDI